jgi:hypothetical protein
MAEDELLELGGCVLNLSGLWGGERNVRHWVDRVASTKEMLKSKKSLHMIHGEDVARSIIGVHKSFKHAEGQRFVSSNRCMARQRRANMLSDVDGSICL